LLPVQVEGFGAVKAEVAESYGGSIADMWLETCTSTVCRVPLDVGSNLKSAFTKSTKWVQSYFTANADTAELTPSNNQTVRCRTFSA
jgi:hypothetical protein